MQEGREKRTCGHCSHEGHNALNCPELHEVRDFVSAFTQKGEAKCNSLDLAWLRALPANWDERPRNLFDMQEPLPPQSLPVEDTTVESTLSPSSVAADHSPSLIPAQVIDTEFWKCATKRATHRSCRPSSGAV